MPSLKSCLAATVFSVLAVADTIKITARRNNTFSPASITAQEGDVLEFHFAPRNHSVVAGDYRLPCAPLPMGTGFFSGFVPVESGEAGQVFRVTLLNADPLVFYSSQDDECARGMVGIVNADETKTLQNYRMRASQLARGVTPGTEMYGGLLAAKSGGQGQSHDDEGLGSNGHEISGAPGDKRPAAQDKRPGTEDDEGSSVDDDKSTSDDDKRPAVDDKRPAEDDKTSSDDDKRPAVDDERPAEDDKTSSDDDKRPAVDDERPAVDDDKGPSDDDESLGVDDDKTPGDKDEESSVSVLQVPLLALTVTGGAIVVLVAFYGH